MTVQVAPGFYRVAAVATALSVVTTLLLIILPRLLDPPGDFAARMALVDQPAYQWRAWSHLLHPLLVFVVALAVALRLRRLAAGLALPGLARFSLWAATETGQQALTLFAFDRWRRAWLAGDFVVRADMPLRAAVYDGLWDAAYALLLIGFLIGCLCYAAAFLRQPGLGRTLGVLYLAAAALTSSLLSRECGGPSLPAAVEAWLYPAVQPLARLLTGVWLWRNAREDDISPQPQRAP